MNAPTRPVLRWHGGKWKLAPWIISHFPKHRVYVEPFGGAASVLLRKERCNSEIYNDLDRNVVNLFRVIREQAGELACVLALTPYARDEYALLYEEVEDPVERARMFVARSFMGFNTKGALERSGFDARINPDSFVGRLRSLAQVPDELAAVASRMRHVIIENVDAVDLIKRCDRADALVYCDPPYVAETRSGKYYKHELDRGGHTRLLEALLGLKASVVISGYPTDLYDDALTDWHRVEIAAHADGGANRTEVLWLNPSCSSALDRDRGAGTLFAEMGEKAK